jgi:anthranilate/para-aminobenzoate synthase component I
MRLSDIEALGSFALLGPGFGNGGFLLLSNLDAQVAQRQGRSPLLVFVSFESPGVEAQVYAAEIARLDRLDIDVPGGSHLVEFETARFREAVETIREAIAAGDVYQVCYTTRARIRTSGGAELFATICAAGVPRFAAWVRLPDGTEFVSASPELFFAINGRRISSEPMKGTARPHQRGPLEQSDKDRCELAMITDLIRNDLVPICRPHSIAVPTSRRTIELPYAIQTVSEVTGELLDGVTPVDALAALHPGGSVTGTPKAAALRMIRSLEAGPRGPYCGALGFCHDHRAIFSLLIRTATRSGADFIYGVGAGIVYESEVERELEELHTKLGALRGTTRH